MKLFSFQGVEGRFKLSRFLHKLTEFILCTIPHCVMIASVPTELKLSLCLPLKLCFHKVCNYN